MVTMTTPKSNKYFVGKIGGLYVGFETFMSASKHACASALVEHCKYLIVDINDTVLLAIDGNNSDGQT